jgi:glycosyltransferase involved in cell wall biosynthesis
VLISLEAWDGLWRRYQHLVSRLLWADVELRVLFVEPPADPLHDLGRGRRPRFGGRARERGDVQPRLWTLQPLKLLPRRIDRGADRRFARTVVRAARRLGMANPVLWINDPAAADVSRVSGWPTLYDITDDWAVADRLAWERARIVGGEQYLLRNAERVVACSAELVRRKSGDRGARLAPIVLIQNGVDTAAYQRAHPRPVDLPKGKVAVYAGTLHADRLDVQLCIATAVELASSVTIVLVGPNALDPADTAALAKAGILILVAKSHADIPAYLQHADALLVPHRVDAFTDSLDPIKLYEYRAAGRPVVSTAVAGFRDAEGVTIAESRAGAFAQTIRDAVASSKADGESRASDADWSVRARYFAQVLSTIRVARETRRRE